MNKFLLIIFLLIFSFSDNNMRRVAFDLHKTDEEKMHLLTYSNTTPDQKKKKTEWTNKFNPYRLFGLFQSNIFFMIILRHVSLFHSLFYSNLDKKNTFLDLFILTLYFAFALEIY